MAQLNKHHQELTDGVGKCSVPMWTMGCPNGFCNEPAYGKPTKCKTYRDGYTGEMHRMDGRYNGYVPALACPNHGGPKPTAQEDEGENIEALKRHRDDLIKALRNKTNDNYWPELREAADLLRLGSLKHGGMVTQAIASLQAKLAEYKSENAKLKMGGGYNCSSCTTVKELAEAKTEVTAWQSAHDSQGDELEVALRRIESLELSFETLRVREATVRDMLGCSQLAGAKAEEKIVQLEHYQVNAIPLNRLLKEEVAEKEKRIKELEKPCGKCGYDGSQGIIICEACTFEERLKTTEAVVKGMAEVIRATCNGTGKCDHTYPECLESSACSRGRILKEEGLMNA